MSCLVDFWLFTTPIFYQGAVLLKGRAALDLSKLELLGKSFSGLNRIFYIDNMEINLEAKNNIYGSGFANVYFAPSIGSLNSDNNCFGSYNFSFDSKPVTKADLDEYQPPDWCKWKLENPAIRESGFGEATAA